MSIKAIRSLGKNTKNQTLQIQNNTLKSFQSAKLLGLTIDKKLKFDTHIDNLSCVKRLVRK